MDTSLNAINAKIVETLNSVNAEFSDEARRSSENSRRAMGWPGLSQTWNRGSKKPAKKARILPATAAENAGDEIDKLNDLPPGTSSSDPAREEWNNQFEKALDAIDDIADETEREAAKDALRDMDKVSDIDNFIDPRTGNELSDSTNWKEEENMGDGDPEFQEMEQDFRPVIPKELISESRRDEFERQEREDMEELRRTRQEAIERQEMADDNRDSDGNRQFENEERDAMEESRRSRQDAIEEQIAREESNRRSFEEAAEPDNIKDLSMQDLEEFEILADNPRTQQKFADERAKRSQNFNDEPTDADSLASNPAALREMSVTEIAEFITESDNRATRKALTDELDRRVAQTNP